MRKANSVEEISDIEDELIDRFGEYPIEVDNLIQLVKVKVYALMFGIYQVKEDKRHFHLFVSKNATEHVDGEKLFMDTEAYGRIMQVGVQNSELKISVRTKDVKQLVSILEDIQGSRLEAV